jgi:hypothetical protein
MDREPERFVKPFWYLCEGERLRELELAFSQDPPTRYVAKRGVEVPGLLVSIRMTAFVA